MVRVGRLLILGAAWIGLAGAVGAQPLTAGPSDCGGDAFSSAQVVEGPRRGPVTAAPETLCADLAPTQPAADIGISVDPLLVLPDGRGWGPTPYGPRPQRRDAR